MVLCWQYQAIESVVKRSIGLPGKSLVDAKITLNQVSSIYYSASFSKNIERTLLFSKQLIQSARQIRTPLICADFIYLKAFSALQKDVAFLYVGRKADCLYRNLRTCF